MAMIQNNTCTRLAMNDYDMKEYLFVLCKSSLPNETLLVGQ